ncbi:SDR family oxidoreductase [Algoriphagus sp. Y33]|uniref:SDR family oxidoreductase n=1 Tax=Algoriphagus sp. Y33 TaxID=2772483 RepID=UPI00177C3176|nr:SDR family oxidoreductase [Algoriphagus sp. Y33]
MKKKLENKVGIVTGGATGMGRASALAFAKEGAKVVVADVVDASETIQLIKAEGGEAIYIKCDVSKEMDVKSMVEKTVSTYGKLDFAFNNAGIEGKVAPIAETTSEEFDRLMNINLKGVWLCMKYEIPEMLKNGKGSIVNTASAAGLVAVPTLPIYVASKHGVVGLTKTTAVDYAKQGLRVNAICPGGIKTPMFERTVGGDNVLEAQIAAQQVIGRLGTPEEIANAAVFLCSDDASFITGIALPVDGGWIAQ